MKFIVCTVAVALLAFSATLLAQDQKISGTIYFDDGTTQTFSDLKGLWLINPTNGGDDNGIRVSYENSERLVPYSKLVSWKIRNFEIMINKGIWAYQDYNYVGNITAVVKTVTGATLETHYDRVVSLEVSISDELTGEYRNQTYFFCKPQGHTLLIRKIVFNNPMQTN